MNAWAEMCEGENPALSLAREEAIQALLGVLRLGPTDAEVFEIHDALTKLRARRPELVAAELDAQRLARARAA